MLLIDLVNLLLLGFLLLILAALLAPFESLGWWAGWFSSRDDSAIDEPNYRLKTLQKANTKTSKNYIVFLDGISRASRIDNVYRTSDFITELNATFSDTSIISDVFPYSPQGKSLTENRVLSYFWMLLEDSHENHLWHRFRILINLRNLLQVLVSADRRYGPIFNQGAANYIANALLKAGYRANSGQKVYLIGYSGGAQISVGIAPYLKETLGTPLVLISFGGVFVGNGSLKAFKKIYHLLGNNDKTSKRSIFFFPHRWKILKNSSWNTLKREGVIEVINMPFMTHNGKQSYFDKLNSTHLYKSIQKLKSLIET